MLSKIHNSVIKKVWPFSPASGPALSVCSRGDAFMAMPQTVPPKEKASETFAFEFQKTQRMSLQTLLFQRACPLRLTFVRQLPQSGSPWQSLQASSLCQGLSLWERWICEAKTERARTLTLCSSFLNIIQSFCLTPPSVWPEMPPPR